jgi:hypothetical protein
MPDSYGHAKDFFNPAIADGQLNTQRNLLQFTNGSKSQPKVNDILVLDKSRTNSYGHVAIISAVEGGYIEIIQQNAGKYATSRDIMELIQEEGKWVIKNDRVLGWLRIKN